MGGPSLDAVHDGYIYLDHAATTPMRADAVAAMLPFLTEQFANPSGSHRFARQVRKSIDEARDDVADVLGCRPGEVIFTSGGTEADNTAIFGTLDRLGGLAAVPAVEHHAVLHAVESSRTVASSASTQPDVSISNVLATRRSTDVSLVSVMAVNNEVGTHHRSRRGRRGRPPCRTATRSCTPTRSRRRAGSTCATITPHVDLLSLSAHKFGGPKGVGVLMARGRSAFAPMLVGGGQERERRSGTHNVAGHHRDGHGAAGHRHRARRRERSASRRCATRWSTACRPSSTTSTRPSTRAHKVAGSRPRVHRRDRERGVAVPARRGGCVRQCGVVVRERGHGAVPRARRNGCCRPSAPVARCD